MEIPTDIQNLIHEFARPISRPDWRRGCALNRIKLCSCNNLCKHSLKDMIECEFWDSTYTYMGWGSYYQNSTNPYRT